MNNLLPNESQCSQKYSSPIFSILITSLQLKSATMCVCLGVFLCKGWGEKNWICGPLPVRNMPVNRVGGWTLEGLFYWFSR